MASLRTATADEGIGAVLSGDHLLAAKFEPPAELRTHVRRRRLVNRLTGAVSGPLTVVTGPAGSGKTTAAASWVRSGAAPGPVTWLTLDASDDVPGTFWAYALEAFARRLVPLGERAGAPGPLTAAGHGRLSSLVCALDRLPEPVVLVLDGLDKLHDREVTRSLEFVLDHARGRLRLVLLSRVDPMLPLHRYRAEDRVTEIRAAELAFTPHEAGLLMRRHGLAPDRDTVDTLTARTDGWAAGLRLCALAMENSADPDGFVRSLAASERAVSDYLLAEVLDAQPPATRELLMRVSILDRVHPELADALTGRKDSAAVLDRLVRANAFVEPVGDTPWCRLHPLFAGVLRTYLRRGHPGLESRLHRRAARLLADAGRPEDALRHATAAGDWRYACALAVERLMVGRLLTGPDADRLAGLFARMPDDVPGAGPALVAAACRLAAHDLPGSRARLAAAGHRLRRETGRGGPAPSPETRLTHALLTLLCRSTGAAAGSGRAAPAGDCAEPAREAALHAAALMDQVPAYRLKEHPETEALRRYGLACALLGCGRLDEAVTAFAETLGACAGAESTRAVQHAALGRLALAEAARGALTAAEEHAAHAVAVARSHGVPHSRRSGACRLALAAVAVERDDPYTAYHHLDLAEDFPDVHDDPSLAVQRAVLRSACELARGRPGRAADVLAGSGAGRAPWAAARLALARSAVALAVGDPAAALAALHAPGPQGAPGDGDGDGDGPPPEPEAPESPDPARTVAVALAELAAGHTEPALLLAASVEESSAAGPGERVRAYLVRVHAAVLRHDTATARALLARAVDTARPEGLKRPFTESGPWLRPLLRDRDRGRDRSGAVLPDGPGAVVERLSRREREVLAHVALMMSTEEIAAALHLSANTVKTHLRSVYRKLGVSRRREAVERGRELHLL
ncbi:LuxR C-terminal-related transcriptional regulator [Streptomyces sp. GC420]|uniref:LuxR C-terminal-related transcriptional regulator n=1 Tax=Streptomyces sp. GC420 TaxID=2697568 RepID=UPI001414E2EF|nr:LuxR C-terminal-related transcriptional regulator [Streptomyces sp. GC420]NBM19286.1 helix-turn-helix transcriptional regulator [Streptomyces sp. GC420]